MVLYDVIKILIVVIKSHNDIPRCHPLAINSSPKKPQQFVSTNIYQVLGGCFRGKRLIVVDTTCFLVLKTTSGSSSGVIYRSTLD